MSTLLLRQDPFSVEFVSYDVARQPQPQERALPAKEQSPIGVVVTGDNHLSPALPRLSPQRRAERRERLRNAFNAAILYAVEHDARLFVHVGDLFDSPSPSNQDRAFVAQGLAKLRRAGITCVAISGNHDTPRMQTEHGGDAPHRVYDALEGWHYFPETDALRPRLFYLDGLRVAIAGLTNNPSSPPGSDPLAGVPVDDQDGVLSRADVGLLMLHAGIEGLCQPNEGERIIARSSIDALPPIFRAVVAGHIHRYGRERMGNCEVIVSGSTERMEFGGAEHTSGFAWLELGPQGVVRADHISVPEQPRVDLMMPTERLWPGADTVVPPQTADISSGDTLESLADVLPQSRSVPAADAGAVDPLAMLRAVLAQVCTPDTMVRLRLAGPLTREQYHALALRDILVYGQQHAFTFDLDTGGLALVEPERSSAQVEHGGPIVPAVEVDRVAEERIGTLPPGSVITADDVWAAARMLRESLQSTGDREAAR